MLSEGYRNYLEGVWRTASHGRLPPLDATGEVLVGQMDEGGIEKSVVFFFDATSVLGEKHTISEWNDFVAQEVSRYPDRLIGFLVVDPRRGKASLDEIERAVNKLGLSGIKLYPPAGWYPNDRETAYPMYEKAEQLGIPIMMHQGDTPPGRLKYCRPIHLDDVGFDFPDLKIIASHMGMPWVDELCYVAMKNPNIYIDISFTAQLLYKNNPAELIKKLSFLLSLVPDRILFGTDWPGVTTIMTLKESVSMIQMLQTPKSLQESGTPRITQENKDMILGKNAARILNL